MASLAEEFQNGAAEIIMRSWRFGTKKQYRTYLQRWHIFCDLRKINPVCGTIENGIFNEYKNFLSYSAIKTIRSNHTSWRVIWQSSFGQYRYVLESCAAVSSLVSSVSIDMEYLGCVELCANHGTSWKFETSRLITKNCYVRYFVIGSAMPDLHAITLSCMKQTYNHITFELNTLLKTSRLGKHFEPLSFKSYPDDKLLCVVTCLKQYLQKNSKVRDGNDKLWFSFNKAHQQVTKDTIAWWTRTFLG